uniref:Ras association domain-containing protein 7 n=1 Tax=Gopherus evgoodei TaxID=1825980 RepID=A0A8C4WE47_9SAUR
MELKVWVDGIQRVVCGVSDQTTCQEVVIALARAIGQTGRYILIQKLREKERQLLPHECPLESLAKCGQYANDVQFILQRTGPSLAERPSSDSTPQAPERTFIRASLPIKPRPVSTEDSTSRSHPSKEEHWEQDREEFWQSELHMEKECERERQEKVRSLRATMEEYTQKIHELTTKTEVLEKEIQLEMTERARWAKEAPADLEDMAAKMKRDLEVKAKQSAQLESSLASVGKALEEAERNLQAQNQELEELNKELRQCNLQQFIQQTGATVTVLQSRPEDEPQLDQTNHELPACQRNGGQNAVWRPIYLMRGALALRPATMLG